ncbi:MAG: cupin domain-containing protein [Acidobacteria bacterium]|nr:MAG: cupin domain-containing protein [Acidobacteriota bacterium]PYY09013.1 MAG: cupin domain-containing protein [Acidobacteriota bacterium]
MARAKTKKHATQKKSRIAVAGESSLFRQQGIPRTRRKAEVKHIPWNTVEIETLNPLLGRQFVVGRDIMVARVIMKKGCIVPEHSHVNEQVTYILDGALKFWIDGKEIVVNAGEVLTIPPNMPHKAEALADTLDLDVFSPPRADWMNKDDSYLRGTK